MIAAIAVLLLLPASLLIGVVCLPNAWVNWRVREFRRLVTWLAGAQTLIAGSCLVASAVGRLPTIEFVLYLFASELPITVSIFYDGVSSLMFTLVSFVGWVICQYSIRYLEGESTQGRYFRWIAFTLGAVSLMVISGNLLMMVGAWILTSLGLHRLLLHYSHRPAAKRAAWTKFLISRIGDAALIAATVMIGVEMGTLEFPKLFAIVETLTSVPSSLHAAGFLLVAGAATKSAQFPFHTWLPQTLEAPTPVSAFMHAGIVNAGGYLIIRVSPVVALTPWALTVLAIIGGFTTIFAAVVMLTQTSIKKSLAYSTIAQMGFMLLQCGLGAYSAAMLHILAHSLYKAHAFLNSGSVVADRVSDAGNPSTTRPVSVATLAVVGTLMVATLSVSLTLLGIDPTTKANGLLLGGVLCLALTHWIGQVMRSGSHALSIRAVMVAVALCIVYSASYLAIDKAVAESLPTASRPEFGWLVATIVFTGFIGMLVLQHAVTHGHASAILAKWHIHASNGFYVENTLRRVFEPLTNC